MTSIDRFTFGINELTEGIGFIPVVVGLFAISEMLTQSTLLKQVFKRGVAAWKTGHRPGTTAVQWGLARVNSFVTKSSGTWGKADKDLAAKVRG